MILKHAHPRVLFKASMASLALFSALPALVRPHESSSVDILDACRGALLGITLALLFLYFRSARKLRRH